MPTGNYDYNGTSGTWYQWCDTSGTSTNDAWGYWVSSGTTSGSSNYRIDYQPPQLSAEDLERQRIEAQERKRKKEEATNRARELLDLFLTPDQREQLEKQSAILVKSETDRMYRIKKGRAGNIEELDENGKAINRLCVHPRDFVPDFDTMLTQKLWLETNEAELRRIANITPVRQ